MSNTEIKKLSDFSPETIEETKKLIDEGIEQKYLEVEISYIRYIFPFDIGLKFLEAFNSAEEVDREHYSFLKIIPLKTMPEGRIVTRQTYEKQKMRTLLNLSPPDE